MVLAYGLVCERWIMAESSELAIRRPEGHQVTFRRMKFPFEDEGFDKYWHAGSPFLSFFWDSLSAAFAPGETFFIDSARAMRELTDDQALLDEIGAFCKQEGHHTAQHIKFNKMVQEQGVDSRHAEAVFTGFLNRAREEMEPAEMLSVTCALEHFTAGFAHQYLSNPKVTEGADPKVTALWRWHAMEETEHKGTCHDLYEQVDGKYFKRVTVMIGAWFMISAITFYSTFRMLKRDGKLWRGGKIFHGLRYLFGFQGLFTRMIPWYFWYFRRDFHPWKHNNSNLIHEWEADNQEYWLNPPAQEPARLPAATAAPA